MKTQWIDSNELGEAVFALLQECPELLSGKDSMSEEMLLYEAAAQSAMLDLMERRVPDLSHTPLQVRALVTALMSQFLLDLASGPLQNERWEVPRAASPADQARHAIAALLRGKTALRQPPLQ